MILKIHSEFIIQKSKLLTKNHYSFILTTGGVRSSMYGKLPREIVSKFGYQGCLGSLDVNDEAVDPIKNVLVPSQYVSEGCEGK